jgi:hypothetical protein
MRAARTAEYRAVIAAAETATRSGPGERARAAAKLRRIGRRDFFPPPERELAQHAMRALTDAAAASAETVIETAAGAEPETKGAAP